MQTGSAGWRSPQKQHMSGIATAYIWILVFWNEVCVIKRIMLIGQVSSKDFCHSRIGQKFTHYFWSKVSPEEGTQESESSYD